MELFHSRPIAPTRRVALGHLHLPVDPAPGLGGLLLGAVVAASMPALDPESFDELDRLAVRVERGLRVPQPRLRHRLQTDRVGLLRSRHALVCDGDGGEFRFDLSNKGTPAQNVLAAVYAAGRVPAGPRRLVVASLRQAMRWSGMIDRDFVAYLTGVSRGHAWSVMAHRDSVVWALEVLGLAPNGNGTENAHRLAKPGPRVVQRRFREQIRKVHPDHGGQSDVAALRISELNEARRILLATR